ncbi:cadherin-like beta sandwich domain-containing protein [Paenibacillus sp. YN15]|uniref:cadherin-like beta sandwich domain-containing protein n=1 Tax=Paenibacillus sp. YN15 TaxID=1742774 RepID=UPI0015EBC527|nr:cadherin-like beta sandwich domain-containing protein [Paenibacillus sp. YN15]
MEAAQLFLANPQALLKSLTVTPGSLAFAPETVTYNIYAGSGAPSVDVRAVPASMMVQDLLVNGASVASGSVSIIPLIPGTNEITIEVAAFDGTRKTYLVRVIR